ncbi:MAG: pantetheine-phosphate adenylyltransferase [Thermodesulfobacteriota bacterium]
MKRIALYPGSFDPLTRGHINIVERGTRIFDEVVVSVAHNLSKKTTFTLEERLEILKETFRDHSKVRVDYFDGLLVNYARTLGTNILLRGLRTVSDFEYELRMALANKSLSPELETVFMVTESDYGHISSSLIKEIVSLGGSAADMVPKLVEEKLRGKLLRNLREAKRPL